MEREVRIPQITSIEYMVDVDRTSVLILFLVTKEQGVSMAKKSVSKEIKACTTGDER